MDLLERELQLDELQRALDEVADGHGRLVLVSGEAGIGKTALVERFLADHQRSVRELWGACDDLVTPRALGPFHDIARITGGELEEALRAGASGEVLDAILGEVSRGSRPTVMVIEDAHWADQATLDAVRFLGRRLERLRALMVLTFRDDEVPPDHPLRAAVGLISASAVRRVELLPLSQPSVSLLAADHPANVEELYRVTGGNPFFVTEALAVGGRGIPPSVRDAVLARAGHLSRGARDFLQLVSVVPARAERWLLEAAGDLGDLDECQRHGLLQGDSADVWFRHELARLAIEGSLPEGQRRRLNHSVLEAMRHHPVDPARLVHHAEMAGEWRLVGEFAAAAARRATAAGSHREAATHYARAVAHAGALAPQDRAQLLEEYSVECYLTGRAEAVATSAAAEALSIRRALDDQRALGNQLRSVARLQWWSGNRPGAEAAAAEAVEVLERLPPGPELAMAYSSRSQLAMLAQQHEEAITWGSKAIELAKTLGDQTTLVHALNNVGSALWRDGRDSEGRAMLLESLGISRREDLHEHACRAYVNLAWNSLDLRRYPEAAAWLEEGLSYAIAHDIPNFEQYMLATRARLALEMGDWGRAEADAREMLERPEQAGVSRIPALVALGRVQVRRGDHEGKATLERAWEMALRTGELQRIGPVGAGRAELAWLAGDLQRTVEACTPGYRLARGVGDPRLTGELALWMWRGGELDSVPPVAEEPYVLHVTGDFIGAARRFEEIGCPYEAADALSDSEDPEDLRSALATFERMGAAPAAERVRGKLGLGHGTRMLATVLFTDVAGSTELAASLGDRRWGELLDEHDRVSAEIVERFGGRVVKSTGDGILALFDVPSAAVAAARAVAASLRRASLPVRAGLHTGEVELRGRDVGGIAVHIASRLKDLAGAGEIVVSRTVHDLAIGSGSKFTSRGNQALRGVPGEWEVLVTQA